MLSEATLNASTEVVSIPLPIPQGKTIDPVMVEAAKLRIPSIPLLVNVISKRVRQLNAGMRPLLKPLSNNEDHTSIAMREVAEGKLTAEIDFAAPSGIGAGKA